MLTVLARLFLAGILLAAAALKLLDRNAPRAMAHAFGLPRRLALPLAAVEAVLAVAVGAGSDAGTLAAAALVAVFALALARALASGRAGAPCGCFGARSRVSRGALARAVALAAALAALPLLPEPSLSTDEWLGLGLAVALVAIVALLVAVVALAREVGGLRLALGPQMALEIPHEGPEVGSRSPAVERFSPGSSARLLVAVFTSEGCTLCRALEPSLAELAGDPYVALQTFEEVRDADAWQSLDVPGSPFAVALDRDGVVLAKGTFNTLAQLVGLLATAERRMDPARA